MVRYLGMVQDILDLEFYSAKTSNGKSTKYKDRHFQSTDDEQVHKIDDVEPYLSDLGERQPVHVVPLPYASEWISSYARYGSHDMNTVANESIDMEQKDQHDRGKRPLYAEPEIVMESEGTDYESRSRKKAFTISSHTSSDITCEQKKSKINWGVKGALRSDENLTPILAHLYPENDLYGNTNGVRLNDVVEIVGVLSLDPMEATFSSHTNNVSGESDYANPFQSDIHHAHVPPPSQLPRVHVLYHEPVDLDQLSLSHSSTMESRQDATEEEDDRTATIKFFSKHIFQGDDVASEALLMAILSATERTLSSQKDSKLTTHALRNRLTPKKIVAGACVGSLSLNLILPQSCTAATCSQMNKKLQLLLKQVCPIVSSLDLSLSNLNDSNQISVPSKAAFDDFDCQPLYSNENRLSSSPLQLPRGSTLILNDQDMKEGKLNANGYSCMKALSLIAEQQMCQYRFGVSDFPFEADYCVVALSKARRSIVNCSNHLKITAGNDYSAESLSFDGIDLVRAYISRCRAPLSISMSAEICKTAEKSFIARRSTQRKAGKTELDGEKEFHRWLTLSRVQARSRFGSRNKFLNAESGPLEHTVENMDWDRALNLDDAMTASMI